MKMRREATLDDLCGFVAPCSGNTAPGTATLRTEVSRYAVIRAITAFESRGATLDDLCGFAAPSSGNTAPGTAMSLSMESTNALLEALDRRLDGDDARDFRCVAELRRRRELVGTNLPELALAELRPIGEPPEIRRAR